jgi:hypothetical protein
VADARRLESHDDLAGARVADLEVRELEPPELGDHGAAIQRTAHEARRYQGVRAAFG